MCGQKYSDTRTFSTVQEMHFFIRRGHFQGLFFLCVWFISGDLHPVIVPLMGLLHLNMPLCDDV